MPALIAGFLGALVILFLITNGLIKLFSKWNSSIPGILTANGLSLFIATVLAGFGMADGRSSPVFFEGFARYVTPQLVILGFTLWNWNKRSTMAGTAALAAVEAALTSESIQVRASPQTIPAAKKRWWKRSGVIALGVIALIISAIITTEIGRKIGTEIETPRAEKLVTTAAATPIAAGPTATGEIAAGNQKIVREAFLATATEMKATLPTKIDNSTTLVGIHANGLTLIYENEVAKGIANWNGLEKTIKGKVCGSEGMKEAMIYGGSFIYEYRTPPPERKLLGRINITNCPQP
jgi:hypothetical protein